MEELHSIKIFDIEFLSNLYILRFPESKKVFLLRIYVYVYVCYCLRNIQLFIFQI